MGKGRTNKIGLYNKIDKMPDFFAGEKYSLIPMAPKNIITEAKELYNNQKGSLPHITKEVNINKLETEQFDVKVGTLKEIAKNTTGRIVGNGITGVQYKGHIIVYDGNHRINVAILNGQKKIKMTIIKLD